MKVFQKPNNMPSFKKNIQRTTLFQVAPKEHKRMLQSNKYKDSLLNTENQKSLWPIKRQHCFRRLITPTQRPTLFLIH